MRLITLSFVTLLIGAALVLAGSVATDAITYAVTNTNDAGTGSLRWAITQANGSAGTDSIHFAIPGMGPHTIQPTSPLPAIADPLVIDGFTQTGATPNTSPIDQPCNAVLKIELDGTNAGADTDGLHATASGCTVRGLVINRFTSMGINISDCGGHVIEGCFLGTNAAGSDTLGNGYAGISMGNVTGSTVGGTLPAARNVISGNAGPGIELGGSAEPGNAVYGNFIGTDVTGTVAFGNGDGIDAPGERATEIGGTAPGMRNLISGNRSRGILFRDNARDNVVAGNLIGTDRTGTQALGNWAGIQIDDSSENTIGGATAAACNVISGNEGYGVRISHDEGMQAVDNVVQGNYIGVAVSGAAALGNIGEGVHIEDADSNTIGGTGAGEGNVIAFSGDDGIWVHSGNGNALLGNAIFSNDSLGIDLGGSGVTPNDPADADTGANCLQNFPSLSSVSCSGINTRIQGALNSTPNTAFRLEFFSSSVADPSGYGEGETYLGSAAVVTDGAGDAGFDVTLPVPVPGGHRVTATATDPASNTSEFSQGIFVMTSTGALVDGELQLTWPEYAGAAEYWVYGALNKTYFEPELLPPYQYRIATVPSGTTSWSTTSGIADPDSNWAYVIVAVDGAGQELVRSSACGDHDFDMTGTQ